MRLSLKILLIDRIKLLLFVSAKNTVLCRFYLTVYDFIARFVAKKIACSVQGVLCVAEISSPKVPGISDIDLVVVIENKSSMEIIDQLERIKKRSFLLRLFVSRTCAVDVRFIEEKYLVKWIQSKHLKRFAWEHGKILAGVGRSIQFKEFGHEYDQYFKMYWGLHYFRYQFCPLIRYCLTAMTWRSYRKICAELGVQIECSIKDGKEKWLHSIFRTLSRNLPAYSDRFHTADLIASLAVSDENLIDLKNDKEYLCMVESGLGQYLFLLQKYPDKIIIPMSRQMINVFLRFIDPFAAKRLLGERYFQLLRGQDQAILELWEDKKRVDCKVLDLAKNLYKYDHTANCKKLNEFVANFSWR